MGRKLSDINLKEFKKELSIAGDPDKMIEILHDVEALITPRINVHNISEVANVQLVLKKVIADLKHWERILYNRQHPKN